MSDDKQLDVRAEGESTHLGLGAGLRAARDSRADSRDAVSSARRSNAVNLDMTDLIDHSCERDEVCARLELDQPTLDALDSRHELHRFKVDRTWLYPAWQFTDHSQIPHLTSVLDAAEELGTRTLAEFMTTKRADLAVYGEALSPREWLRLRRDPQAVLTPLRDLERPRR